MRSEVGGWLALVARPATFGACNSGRQEVLRVPGCCGTVPRIARCSSSVVEHSLGKGEVESSILSCSTILTPAAQGGGSKIVEEGDQGQASCSFFTAAAMPSSEYWSMVAVPFAEVAFTIIAPPFAIAARSFLSSAGSLA